MYATDPNSIEIDYAVVKKFSALGIAPPSSQEAVEKTEKELRDLKEALNLTGRMQQAEGRAKFLKQESHITSEEYLTDKAKIEGISKPLLAAVARIRKD